jgi:hypothetical protein
VAAVLGFTDIQSILNASSRGKGLLVSITSLLVRRKLTRAIAEIVREHVSAYLATLTPLLQPQTVFGDYIQGVAKQPSRKADQALKELQALYETIAPKQPLNLRRELSPPFDFANATLEITPVDYTHVAHASAGTKTIHVRSPLMWTLTYAGFAPARLQEVLDQKVRGDELQRFILSYILIHLVTTHRPGVTQLLDALHVHVSSATAPEFGDLPLTRIGAGISTERPSDAVVVESAELTGIDAFEEVINVEDIGRLRDPFRERLLDVVRQQTPELA